MGRYYSGDIEGKFMFAVQSSNDADFFGVEGHSDYLHYTFDKDNLEDIKKGISKCKKELGEHKKILDTFFKENMGWNYQMMCKYFEDKHNIMLGTERNVRNMLGWYARLDLGEKIKKCVEENEVCSFEAEL